MNTHTIRALFGALLLLICSAAIAGQILINPHKTGGFRVTGTLVKNELLTIPGTSSPALYSVLSNNHTSYGLDFSKQPDLEAIAEINRFRTVRVEGKLYIHVTETPAGEQLEWLMIRVEGISANSSQ